MKKRAEGRDFVWTVFVVGVLVAIAAFWARLSEASLARP